MEMEVPTEPRFWKTNYQVIELTDENLVHGRCFLCSICKGCLAGKEAVFQQGNDNCWEYSIDVFGLKCASCSKSITGVNNLNFILFNNQVWHDECFRCSICRKSLQGRQVIQSEQSVHCRKCNKTEIFYFG